MPQEIFHGPYIINDSNELNFVSSDYKIYIMGKFEQAPCAETLANLQSMIDSVPVHPIYKPNSFKMKTPYELPKSNPMAFDVYIQSYGGNFEVLCQFSSLFGLAKSRGIIIRTFIPSLACSCASMLAIQGTPGYRIMGENARHKVHFGRTVNDVELAPEIDKAYEDMKNHAEATAKIYLSNTHIPKTKFDQLRSDNYGYLNSKDCLKFGFCDWILTNNGEFISKQK